MDLISIGRKEERCLISVLSDLCICTIRLEVTLITTSYHLEIKRPLFLTAFGSSFISHVACHIIDLTDAIILTSNDED